MGGSLGACQGEDSPRPPGELSVATATEQVSPSANDNQETPDDVPPSESTDALPTSLPAAEEPEQGAVNTDSAQAPSPPEGPESPEEATESSAEVAACAEQSQAIYAQRIEPLLVDDRPKSCNQCHLAGIDLSLFVRSTTCETMACLQDLDLVDLDDPEESTVLGWIGRATPDSPLITEEVIQAEHDGFLEWIEHTAECWDVECGDVTCSQTEDDPFCPSEGAPQVAGAAAADRGGCSELELEHLFRNSVYASRGRCFPCHFSGETRAAPTAPRFFEQSGTCDQSSLVTMRNMIGSGLVNAEAPETSLLLLKPLSEREGGVKHGGHDKFYGPDDPGYQDFSYWLSRYAACQQEGS